MIEGFWGSDGIMQLRYTGPVLEPELDILADIYVSGLKYYRGFGSIIKEGNRMEQEEMLKGLNKFAEACGHNGKIVNMDEELNDLLKVYTDAEAHLKRKEESALETATRCNKSYIEALEERKKVSIKLANLKDKINPEKQCEECDEEDDS